MYGSDEAAGAAARCEVVGLGEHVRVPPASCLGVDRVREILIDVVSFTRVWCGQGSTWTPFLRVVSATSPYLWLPCSISEVQLDLVLD